MSDTSLTVAENLIWIGQKLHPDSPLYNMPMLFELPPVTKACHVRLALERVVQDFDTLRMVVVEENGRPVRKVLPQQALNLTEVDLSASADCYEAAREWARRRARCVLDIDTRLFDAALLTAAPDRLFIYLNQHHIITDGTSTSIVIEHLAKCIEALSEDRLDEVPQPPGFIEYVRFEKESSKSEMAARARDYWSHSHGGTADPPRPYGVASSTETSSVRLTHSLGEDRSRALREVAGGEARMLTENMSLFSIFATILTTFLYRVSDTENVVFGAMAHNRPASAFRRASGLFVELFPFSVRVDASDTFSSLLKRVQEETVSFLRNVHPGASSAEMHSKINVILNYIAASFPTLHGQQLNPQWIHPDEADANHLVRVQVHDFDSSGIFDLFFDFNKDAFDEQLRLLAVHHFIQLVDAFLANRSTPIGTIALAPLGKVEGPRFDGAMSFEGDVIATFERQVAAQGNAEGIECQDRRLSYQDLDAAANRIANMLIDGGLAVDEPVALRLPRSIEFVAALLGIMKAGGTSCPVSVGIPPGRWKRVSRDLGNRFEITKGEIEASSGYPADPPKRDRGDLAYILYTSGSTGQPKGVAAGHNALANYIGWAIEAYRSDDHSTWPLFTSTDFDLTLTSILVPLLSGGRIVVYPESEEGPDASVIDVFAENRVTHVKLTPSHLRAVRHLDLADSSITTLVVGGERFGRPLALQIIRQFGRSTPAIVNEYGPTEATIGCVAHWFSADRDTSDSVPIGRSIPGCSAHVFDASMHGAPPGCSGELYLSGTCLTEGYWRDEALTSERFLPHPQFGRIYKTGDRVKVGPDGILEFLGRNDDQVKIRGHRIELGEIEAVIESQPTVSACAVVVSDRRPSQRSMPEEKCIRCGLSSTVPGTAIDDSGVCNFCSDYDSFAARLAEYWGSREEFESILRTSANTPERSHDCIVLLSGGKDSTFALSQIVEMGFRPLALTLDNGFIAETAKENIRRVTDEVGVEHVFRSTPAMNEIFADSLNRHANVCNGCFKTIYSLSLETARERNIPIIVTGLSRGQLFETRLTGGLFTGPENSFEMIDLTVLEARKAYHRVDDAVNRLLGLDWLDEEVLDQIRFVDFYRYFDVDLRQVMEYLETRLPWIRPEDTGRSTNCLINDLGIFVHKRTRGYHNYAYPYAWDVRLGHKRRDEALAELDDQIDESRMNRLMDEIGYAIDAPDGDLIAYVVTGGGSLDDLTSTLANRLPHHMIPSRYVEVERLPQTPSGKVDRSRLVESAAASASISVDYVAPRNASEAVLCRAWEEALGRRVGTDDNFFEIGGDSLTAIQIASRLRRDGLRIAPADLFRNPTVSRLASALHQGGHDAESDPHPEGEKSRFGLGDRLLSQLESVLSENNGTEGN